MTTTERLAAAIAEATRLRRAYRAALRELRAARDAALDRT